MSKKHKKGWRALIYFEYFLISISIVSGCASISVFASLVGFSVGITSSAVGLKIYAITAGIKKYKWILKKEKKKHDHVVLLAQSKLNSIAVLISKALSNSYINQGEFVSVSNVLREYNEMKKEIKKSWECCRIYYIKTIETYCVTC